MENKNIITRDGLKELQAELKHLIEVERPTVIEEIAEARSRGDLSENAEFDAAREKQGQVEDRIREIEAIIENSIIATSDLSKNIRIGSNVKVKNLKTDETKDLLIVGTLEADPFENKISNVSPLGEKLMGKSEKDQVKVTVINKGSKITTTWEVVKVKNS